MPESSEVRALVEQGYLRMTDIAPILGVTIQRVSQIIAERETSPGRRKWSGSVVCGCEGTWSGAGCKAAGMGSARVRQQKGRSEDRPHCGCAVSYCSRGGNGGHNTTESSARTTVSDVSAR